MAPKPRGAQGQRVQAGTFSEGRWVHSSRAAAAVGCGDPPGHSPLLRGARRTRARVRHCRGAVLCHPPSASPTAFLLPAPAALHHFGGGRGAGEGHGTDCQAGQLLQQLPPATGTELLVWAAPVPQPRAREPQQHPACRSSAAGALLFPVRALCQGTGSSLGPAALPCFGLLPGCSGSA